MLSLKPSLTTTFAPASPLVPGLFEGEIPTALVAVAMSAQTMQYRGVDLILASVQHEARGLGSPHDAVWHQLLEDTDATMAQHIRSWLR